MCTAVVYRNGKTYCGRNLDNSCSYGEEIVVYFDGRLRDIRKFESADALKAQLKIDLEKIR